MDGTPAIADVLGTSRKSNSSSDASNRGGRYQQQGRQQQLAIEETPPSADISFTYAQYFCKPIQQGR
jgi:hypothetical protein